MLAVRVSVCKGRAKEEEKAYLGEAGKELYHTLHLCKIQEEKKEPLIYEVYIYALIVVVDVHVWWWSICE